MEIGGFQLNNPYISQNSTVIGEGDVSIAIISPGGAPLVFDNPVGGCPSDDQYCVVDCHKIGGTGLDIARCWGIIKYIVTCIDSNGGGSPVPNSLFQFLNISELLVIIIDAGDLLGEFPVCCIVGCAYTAWVV